jgi:transposase-like protein
LIGESPRLVLVFGLLLARRSLGSRRDARAARRFFARAPGTLKVIPREVVTDAAPVYPAVLEELVPAAWHHLEQYANNPIEADTASSSTG